MGDIEFFMMKNIMLLDIWNTEKKIVIKLRINNIVLKI